MIRKILLLALCLTNHAAFASGTTVGNGGDALICSDPKTGILSAGIYDFYEAEHRFQRKIVYSRELDVQGKVLDLISRLSKINPSRVDIYKKWAQEFFQEAEFLRDVQLVDIPDTGDGFYPSNCKIEQLAVQRTPKFPGEKRYVINQNIWDALDANNKAGLIVHEIILRDSVGEDSKNLNSINARYFHALLLSNAFEGITLKAYHEQLKFLQFAWADSHDGIPFRLFHFEGEKIAPNKFSYTNDSLMSEIPYDREINKFEVSFRRKIAGKVYTLDFSPEWIRSIGWGIPVNGYDAFHYFPNGQVQAINIRSGDLTEANSKMLQVKGDFTGLGFYANGSFAVLMQKGQDQASSWVVAGANHLKLTLQTSSAWKVMQLRENGSLYYISAFNDQEGAFDKSLAFAGEAFDSLSQTVAALGNAKATSFSDRMVYLNEDNSIMIAQFIGTHKTMIQGKPVGVTSMVVGKVESKSSLNMAVLGEPVSLKRSDGAQVEYSAGASLTFNKEGLVNYIR